MGKVTRRRFRRGPRYVVRRDGRDRYVVVDVVTDAVVRRTSRLRYAEDLGTLLNEPALVPGLAGDEEPEEIQGAALEYATRGAEEPDEGRDFEAARELVRDEERWERWR